MARNPQDSIVQAPVPNNETRPAMKVMKPMIIFAIPASETITAPGETELLDPVDIDQTGSDYRVILYNDEWHSMEEVVMQIVKATGYSQPKAEAIMMEAHRKGRAICYRGARDECQRVCRVLREIRLQCEVDCD